MGKFRKIIKNCISIGTIVITGLLFIDSHTAAVADHIFLMEKSQPEYWNYLRENMVAVDLDDNNRSDIYIYPLSKFFLQRLDYKDLDHLMRDVKLNSIAPRKVIWFLDGTGIDLNTLQYGRMDKNTWSITEPLDQVEKRDQCYALSKSDGREKHGINGIQPEELPLNQITDFYLYLSALKDTGHSFAIAVTDDAMYSLGPDEYEALRKLGLKEDLEYRASYIAIVSHGQCIFEKQSMESMEYSGEIDGLPISVMSAGNAGGNYSSIVIGATEYSKNHRGMNMAVLKDGMVVDSVVFDTHSPMFDCIR